MRQRYGLFYSILFCLFASATSAHAAGEIEVREQIMSAAQRALKAEDFAQIAKLEKHYLTTKSRTPSGTWSLFWFYLGLNRDLPQDVSPSDRAWSARLNLEKRWIAAQPRSPAGYLSHASTLIAKGWAYRGEGYADTVRPDDWSPFFEHVEEAASFLVANKQVAGLSPHWYVQFAVVAKALSYPMADYLETMEEGLAKSPDYQNIYFMGLDYFLPKWGGNLDQLDAWARAAVKRTRETDAGSMYARVYWVAWKQAGVIDRFRSSKPHWEAMKAGMNDVFARYPDVFNAENFMRMTCEVGDRDHVRHVWSEMVVPGNVPGKSSALASFDWSDSAGRYGCGRARIDERLARARTPPRASGSTPSSENFTPSSSTR